MDISTMEYDDALGGNEFDESSDEAGSGDGVGAFSPFGEGGETSRSGGGGGFYESERFLEHRVNLGDAMIITRTTRAEYAAESDSAGDETMHLQQNEDSCQELVGFGNKEQRHSAASGSSSGAGQFQFDPSTVVVPDLKNAEEIFQVLSQKIAKYCQVLADLTSCEVFYKAQLPEPPRPPEPALPAHGSRQRKSTYVRRNKRRNDGRSLYWGTYNMLHEYSHNKGIIFDKDRDCLIKLSRSHATHVNHLIEEILRDPQTGAQADLEAVAATSVTSKVAAEAEKEPVEPAVVAAVEPKEKGPFDDVQFKECRIFVNRLDEASLAGFYEKFEREHMRQEKKQEEEDETETDEGESGLLGAGDLLPDDEELFSDHNQIVLDSASSDDPDVDSYHRCESCLEESGLPLAFKHLTQLKLHELRVHKKLNLSSLELFQSDDVTSSMINLAEIYSCSKCNKNSFKSHLEYIKHLVLCFYPGVYTCKTCQRAYDNYRAFHFHCKYVHAELVYMCPFCDRRFQTYADLLEHDRIIHFNDSADDSARTDSLVCDYCSSAAFGTRSQLYEHYKSAHLGQPSTQTPAAQASQEAGDAGGDDDDDDDNIQVDKRELIRGLLDRKYKCRYCPIRVYSKQQLKEHETHVHKDTVLFCPVCDKRFTNKDRLSAHMKCHSEPSLECKVCGKKFRRLCNLYNHELVHGLTEHAFMLCKFCGRGFRSRRDYNNHVIANHREHLVKNEISPINVNSSSKKLKP